MALSVVFSLVRLTASLVFVVVSAFLLNVSALSVQLEAACTFYDCEWPADCGTCGVWVEFTDFFEEPESNCLVCGVGICHKYNSEDGVGCVECDGNFIQQCLITYI
jgi:hypothetical protein